MDQYQTQGFSSAFDDLLEQSRRGWDALTRKPGGGASLQAPSAPRAAAAPAAQSAARSSPASIPLNVLGSGAANESARRVWDASKSEAAAALSRKLGAGWRVDVAERRREAGEFTVLVTLTVPATGVSVTRLGRGEIPQPEPSSAVQGTAGGVKFALAGGTGAGGNPQSPDDRGFRRAIENGLAECAKAL